VCMSAVTLISETSVDNLNLVIFLLIYLDINWFLLNKCITELKVSIALKNAKSPFSIVV
jgi:hypothetical protein